MLEEAIKDQYLEVLPKYREFHARMQDLIMKILAPNPHIHKIESRFKSFESTVSKLKRKARNSIEYVRDIVAFRVVVASEKDMVIVFSKLAAELKATDALCHNFSSFEHDEAFETNFPVDFVAKSNPAKSIFLFAEIPSQRANLEEWSKFGHCIAEIQIVTVLGQALMEAANALHSANQHEVQELDISQIDIASRLNLILAEFSSLLDTEHVQEKRDIHPFIANHPFLLHPNPSEFFSEAPIGLGTEFRIDFLIRESDGKYLLVEIENCRHPLFVKSGDFSRQLNHAVRQVEDWQQWIEENLPTVQRTYPDMISPKALVVIGRSRNLSSDQRMRLERRNINFRGKISIWTYDNLIENAKGLIGSISRNL